MARIAGIGDKRKNNKIRMRHLPTEIMNETKRDGARTKRCGIYTDGGEYVPS